MREPAETSTEIWKKEELPMRKVSERRGLRYLEALETVQTSA